MRRATFAGRRYQILWAIPAKTKAKHQEKSELALFGVCDHPERKRKAICYDLSTKDSDSPETLETLLHEAFHASFWNIREETIEHAASDIAKFLFRLGYRPTKPLEGAKE